MNRKMKSIIVTLLVLTLASFAVFAEGTSEKTADFATLDFETATYDTIKASFQNAVDSYMEQYNSIYETMQKAYSKGDAQTFFEAKGLMENLPVPVITEEQTETLVSRILNETDAEAKKSFAQWLYDNSRYYRPTMTFSRQVEGESGKNSYSYSYRYSISAKPGETVTLPTIKATDASDGVFVGWGTTPDEVVYQAGEKIEMPYTDQSLYAVYKAGVRFVDSVTGVDVFEDGDSISAPELEAPDDSYFFLGWYDAKGEKAEGSASLDIGESATYYAKWLSMMVSNISTRYYKDLTVPAGEQVKLSFSLENLGNTNTGKLSVELAAEDEASLKVLTGTLSSYGISAGQARSGSFVVMVSGNSGDTVKADLVISDADGHSWSTPVVFTVK